jgi:transposase
MIGPGARGRIFAYAAPCDMRKGIDTLAGLVVASGHDVANGDVYLFLGKNRKRAKCLWFDGICARLLINRIDSGRFAPLWRDDARSIELTQSELLLFLDGSKLVGKIALTPPRIDRKQQSRVSSSAFR